MCDRRKGWRNFYFKYHTVTDMLRQTAATLLLGHTEIIGCGNFDTLNDFR